MEENLRMTLYEISTILMKNEQKEAEAVDGYNEQLNLI